MAVKPLFAATEKYRVTFLKLLFRVLEFKSEELISECRMQHKCNRSLVISPSHQILLRFKTYGILQRLTGKESRRFRNIIAKQFIP